MDEAVFRLLSGLIDGVTIGSVYALMALGLSLTFGITRIYNFAHGSFFTWGAYFAWAIPTILNKAVPYWVTFPLVVILMFFFGMVFEKLVISPLRKSPNWIVVVMITTLASTLVLDTAALIIFGPLTKSLPPLFEGSLVLGAFVLSANDMAVFVSAVIVITALMLFLNMTRTGKAMKAVAQDLTGANMVGIYVNRIFGYSLGMSAILAGLAGILLAPKYFIEPMGGWVPFIKSFVIVFFGGLGSFTGTIVAAIFLGIVEAMVDLYISKVWVMPIWFGILIGVLIIRPKGLLGVWE